MYNIVDLRGFIIRAYSSGIDEEGVYDVENNETINASRYGLENFMNNYLAEWSDNYPKDKQIFCLEGGNQFRTSLYPEYKGTRNKDWSKTKSNEINKAQGLVEELLKKLGFLLCKQEGMEADDVVAYLCKELEGPKLVQTVDGDLKVLSALDEVTVAYHSIKTGVEYVTGETGDLPAVFVTLQKSIVGDTSDNYKGVTGMGPKAWSDLVETYGVVGLTELTKYVSKHDWDELKADAEELDCKLLMKLYNQRDEWMLSYQLAKLYPHLINSVSGRKFSKLEWFKELPDQVYIAELLDEMEDYEGGADWLYALMPEYTLVTNANFEKCMEDIQSLLKQTTLIGWDYETYDPLKSPEMNQAYAGHGAFVDVLSSVVTGCSFALGSFCNDVYYFSSHHLDTDNLSPETMKDVMKMFFDSGIEMVAHNSQFEASVTKVNYDLALPFWTDTAMFAKNLFEAEPAGLKDLSKKHLNYDQQTYQETLGDADDMSQLTGLHVLSYACDDSIVTAHLLHLFRLLSELEGSRRFIEDYDCNSLAILVDGFVEGVPINLDLLTELKEQDEKDHDAAMKLVRSSLKVNCSVPNAAGAKALYKDIKKFEEAKLKDKDAVDIDQKMLALEAKILEASIYKTPAQIYKDVEFKPTPTQINKVISYLEDDTKDLLPNLASVSGKAVIDYMVEVEDLPKPVELDEYLALMAGCAGKQMKAKEGEAYEKFAHVSAKVLKENSRPVKVGTELNFGSPAQMTHLLYSMLGLPVRLRTKMQRGSKREQLGFSEGGPSTQENALQLAIGEDCTGEDEWKAEVLKGFMVVSKCTTRNGLYWTPYPLWIHPKDGNIHPQIKQSATVTHRPTGASPNLLQVSKGEVRTVFVGGETDEGEEYIYVSIDFSGQELRIIASETGDPVMLDAYIGDVKKDLHTVTACAIGKSYISKVDPTFDLNRIKWDGGVIDYEFFAHTRDEEPVNGLDMVKLFKLVRDAAKTINFGVAYGAGPQTIARDLFISVELAKKLMEALFARFTELPKWKERVWKLARQKGYVATVYGSRRHCWPDIISKDNALKSRMERQVANFLIQGTAADILKIVMTNSIPIFKETGAKLLAPVYDEIAARVPRYAVVKYIELMSECMSVTPPGHKVPMVPEASIGLNWGDQKELGAFPSKDKIEAALNTL